MTDTAIPLAMSEGTPEERAALPPMRVLADIGLITGRNLRRMLRNPQLIVFSTIQPLMQLILFAFVFGAVASVDGPVSYKDFVIPAVLVQSMTFAAMGSGVGIANDLQSGMVDRLRSLPIARSAFLVGRTVSDSTRLSIQALLLVSASLLIGFRFHNGVIAAIGMVIVVVMFGVALTAFSGWIGLAVANPETVQAAVFIPILPLVFTSSAFAPVSSLPGWMQPIAEWNPVTAAIDTARGLALGDDALFAISGVHLHTAALHFIIWWTLIVVRVHRPRRPPLPRGLRANQRREPPRGVMQRSTLARMPLTRRDRENPGLRAVLVDPIRREGDGDRRRVLALGVPLLPDPRRAPRRRGSPRLRPAPGAPAAQGA